MENMTFGEALIEMRKDFAVARAGWNGKGMYAVLMPGYPDGIGVDIVTSRVHCVAPGTVIKCRPYFQLWTAQKDCAMWTPNTSDLLAEDWLLVDIVKLRERLPI